MDLAIIRTGKGTRVRNLALAITATALAGCVDDATGKWVDPVTFSSVVGQGVVRSRSAAKPPSEWEVLCKTSFAVQRNGPPPAPDGLVVGGGPAATALALRRAGAAYAALHVDETDVNWLRPLITGPGIYRVRRTELSTDCDARLDEVIRRWNQGDAWSRAARCLTVERIGPYVSWDTRVGSPAAPYFVRPVSQEKPLGSDFKVTMQGEVMIERTTGREVTRQIRSAQLAWRIPDKEHVYWGETRYCGPGAVMGTQIGILGERLFAGG